MLLHFPSISLRKTNRTFLCPACAPGARQGLSLLGKCISSSVFLLEHPSRVCSSCFAFGTISAQAPILPALQFLLLFPSCVPPPEPAAFSLQKNSRIRCCHGIFVPKIQAGAAELSQTMAWDVRMLQTTPTKEKSSFLNASPQFSAPQGQGRRRYKIFMPNTDFFLTSFHCAFVVAHQILAAPTYQPHLSCKGCWPRPYHLILLTSLIPNS